MHNKEELDLLIIMLKCIKDKNRKAVLLQDYISERGPIPDEYGPKILELMEKNP